MSEKTTLPSDHTHKKCGKKSGGRGNPERVLIAVENININLKLKLKLEAAAYSTFAAVQ